LPDENLVRIFCEKIVSLNGCAPSVLHAVGGKPHFGAGVLQAGEMLLDSLVLVVGFSPTVDA
jgi:hypothetical protein